jgi:thymidylate synthase
MLTASGAGGINEIQYAALLMMIAKVTEKEPGVFTHFVANEQIYDRHIDNAHEMLRRAETLASQESDQCDLSKVGSAENRQPVLLLHKEKGCSFEEITIDDFEMRDYAPMKPQLKFELGI